MTARSLPVALAALAACALGAAAFAQASEITDASTTRDVHDVYIIPGSNALFAAETEAPETDEDWAALEAAAEQVIEGAKLLMAGNRPPGSSDWLMYAGEVDLMTRATISDAIKPREPDEFVFTNGDMMAACTSCHQQFRNP